METDILTVLAAVIGTMLAAVLAALVLYAGKRGSGRMGGATEFLDGSGDCDICFGEPEGDMRTCPCGKTFHSSCAEAVGTCPYCGRHSGEFGTAEDSRVRCPNCGRYVAGFGCRCGALVPRNGVFRCACGGTVSPEGVCGGCGREFETRS